MAIKFEAGATYTHGWAGDASLKTHLKIIKRTAKSVWIEVNGKLVRRAVEVAYDCEQIKPYGSYSMCSILFADKKAV